MKQLLAAPGNIFRRIVEEATDFSIMLLDESGSIAMWNAGAETIFGYTQDEVLGRHFELIFTDADRAADRPRIELETARADGRAEDTRWHVGKSGRRRFMDGVTMSVRNDSGEIIGFSKFGRDITERHEARTEAEAARAQLERRAEEEAAFRHLASALTGAVEMIDVLHEITNRATHVTRADGVYVERILEHGANKLVEVVASAGRGAPPRGLRVSFPGSMTDEILQGSAPVVLASMAEFGRSMAPYLADTCSDCEVLVTPLVAEHDVLGALVLLNNGASGRRFRDNDIVRARTLGDLTSLALRRVRLMEEEREAKEKAEAAVRVRDETLGIVSHDLRNPLTKIALSAELLADSTADEQPELVSTILASARQMQRLIQDLLDVARMETGKLSVAREEIDPEPLVREMCESNSAIALQKRQTIACHFEPHLPAICGDRERLVQVFGNLIGNAMKFAPERGTITVEAHRGDEAVLFVVRDTGPGIPEADLKKVFTPYWQAKKTAHMGAGLGLAIVRGIVEAHGGKVWAENALDGGAVFSFTIPTA